MIQYNKIISGLILMLSLLGLKAQDKPYSGANTGNPLLPGYFADPTIFKSGDTYYIFATTDGVRLASGEPQVWRSKDFVNWYDQEFDLPFSLSNVWAPDIIKSSNGKYYYFHGNCEAGCNVYGYVSDSIMGPWERLNNEGPMFTPDTLDGLPALDQHYFLDDDGALYVYYGTWIHNFNGLGWLKIDTADMVTVLDKGFIPNSELPEIFEAPYMLKRNDKYIMMYSSGDCQASSYRVQYAYSNDPTGPFKPGANNPILETNSDGTIDGPGHHSILLDNGKYYIVYHRHDNPHSCGGEFRQVCVDSLVFLNDSTIAKVVPTHTGIGYLAENTITAKNHAFQAKAMASSTYHLVNGEDDYIYYPSYATDNNNGTMWRAASTDKPAFLVVDLESETNIKRVMIQFEYSTFYYQYKIEYSSDSSNWAIYAGKTNNKKSGSPMIDDGDINARYLKVTITGTEKTGMFPAIWNIKVYSELFETIALSPEISGEGPGVNSTKSLLVKLNAKDLPLGEITTKFPNNGSIRGEYDKMGNPTVEMKYNVKAVNFDGDDYLHLTEKAPLSLSWNSPYTVSAWVLNPAIDNAECIVVWSGREGNLMGEYAALMYGTNTAYGASAHWGVPDMPYKEVPSRDKWHHIALTFDGMIEKVYVDGKLDNQEQKNLFVHTGNDVYIAYSGEPTEYLNGYIASLRIYDKCFGADSIQYLMAMDSLDIDYTATTPVSSPYQSGREDIFIYYNKYNDKLTIRKKNGLSPVSRVDVVDVSGRKLKTYEGLFNSGILEFDGPEVDNFIVIVVTENAVYSEFLTRY
jgi:xylan 1,4-beta-xylosidase